MWEWRTREAQRIESVTGLKVPAAKGATVRGIKLAATSLQSSHRKLLLLSRHWNVMFGHTFQKSNGSYHVWERCEGLGQHRSLFTNVIISPGFRLIQ
jgi:hypothetical protein